MLKSFCLTGCQLEWRGFVKVFAKAGYAVYAEAVEKGGYLT